MPIRPAVLADLRAVQRCAREAYRIYVPRIGRRPAPMIADFQLSIEQGRLYVLEPEDQVVGYVVFYPRDDHIHLENVAVLPDRHGMGYGTQLIMFVEQEAVRLGYAKIELYTNEKMTENIKFYPYLGYEEVGRWEEDGFNRVFFRKEL